MKIVIVDYGMGNLHSISSTLEYLGVSEVKVSAEYDDLQTADKIILPGVGSFAKAMEQIHEKKIDQALHKLAGDKKKPLLGICLGMQLLGASSTEQGFHKGLGFVNGVVEKFDTPGLPVPHVGFNQVKINPSSVLYKGLSPLPDFYFTHSYRMLCDDDIHQSLCDYGGDFVAGFEKENIAGVQFHPELSQYNGLQLYRNFIERF